MKKILSAVLSFVMIIGLFAINPIEINADVITNGFKLQITDTVKEVKAGKLHMMQTNIGEIGLTNKDITWKSSDSSILKTYASGRIRGVKYGKATVTATYNGVSVSYPIQVRGKKIIGIDAGHQTSGMNEKEPNGPGSSVMKAKVSTGTSGVYTKKREAIVNLQVAKKLRKELINRGYEVVMTRTKMDVKISNVERATKLNDAGCNIAVRIHCNGSDDHSVNGALMMCASSSNPYVGKYYKKSRKLNDCILDKYIAATGLRNRGVLLTDDLTGTNWSTIPTALIEMGFMTNKNEDIFLCSKDGQTKMVQGIADGIDAYFGYDK